MSTPEDYSGMTSEQIAFQRLVEKARHEGMSVDNQATMAFLKRIFTGINGDSGVSLDDISPRGLFTKWMREDNDDEKAGGY
jgi:hypothetical protein